MTSIRGLRGTRWLAAGLLVTLTLLSPGVSWLGARRADGQAKEFKVGVALSLQQLQQCQRHLVPRPPATSLRTIGSHSLERKPGEILGREILLENPVQQTHMVLLRRDEQAKLALAEFEHTAGPLLRLASGQLELASEVIAQPFSGTVGWENEGIRFLVNAVGEILDAATDAG